MNNLNNRKRYLHDCVIAAPDQVRGDSALHDCVIAGLTRNPLMLVDNHCLTILMGSRVKRGMTVES